MGLESNPTTLAELNSAWPLSTDDPRYGDNHIRNVKAVLKALDTADAEIKGRLVSRQVFNASGTWTKPAGIRRILVKAKGDGGGGGGASTSTTYPGGGGGEGGYCEKWIDVSAIASVVVTVGTGGAGGARGSDGFNGTDGSGTTFGAHLTAGGGKGGNACSLVGGRQNGTGGAGGTATNGDVNLPGACGGNINIPGGVPYQSGCGGGQGGGRSLDPPVAGDGNDGVVNSGGGGSGGMILAPTYGDGGAGGSGYCIVWEYT